MYFEYFSLSKKYYITCFCLCEMESSKLVARKKYSSGSRVSHFTPKCSAQKSEQEQWKICISVPFDTFFSKKGKVQIKMESCVAFQLIQ